MENPSLERHKICISLSVALNNTGGFSVYLLSAPLSLFQPLFFLQPNFQKMKPESYHSPTLKSSVTSSCSTATPFIPCFPPAPAGPALDPCFPPAPEAPLLGPCLPPAQAAPSLTPCTIFAHCPCLRDALLSATTLATFHSSSQMTSLPIKVFLIPSSHPSECHLCP